MPECSLLSLQKTITGSCPEPAEFFSQLHILFSEILYPTSNMWWSVSVRTCCNAALLLLEQTSSARRRQSRIIFNLFPSYRLCHWQAWYAISSTICVLSEKNRFKRKVSVLKTLLQIKQNWNRNLQDTNVGFWKKKCLAEHRSCCKCFQQCNHCINQGTASRGQHRIDSNCSHQDKKYNLEIILSHYVDHVFEDFQPKWCRISDFPHTFSASHLVYVTTKLKKKSNYPNFSKIR